MTPAALAAGLAGGLTAIAARDLWRAAPSLAGWIRGTLRPLELAGSEGRAPSRAERRRLGLLAAAVLLFCGTWLFGPAPAAPLAAAGPATAGWAVQARTHRYRRSVERALPLLANAVADALAAGRSVHGALLGAAQSLEGPAAAELARLRSELELGVSLERALAGLGGRIRSPRLDAFAAALLTQRIAGGDLIALLRRQARAGAARERSAADARSATTQARFTGLLVAAMPAGAALMAELLAPGFVAGLLANGASRVLLAMAATLQLLGFFAIRRLGRVTA